MIDYLEQGCTINGAYYAGELRRLRQEIAILHLQDNALQIAITAATECGPEILPHPPYSPNMASPVFYLFQKLNPIFMVHSMKAMEAS